MKLLHIELNQLKLSTVNVRKHGIKDVSDLVASIRSLGVIQPLLVRPNCEGFEVIAGQRRLLACQALEQETGNAEPVPCAILDTNDDAAAIEASLAENIARLPMDEIDQYEAFNSLKTKGRTIEDIAGQFGVTELLVKKRLAIANLIDPILNAYRKEEIDATSLRHLTMATKSQQKAWFKLFRDPQQHEPTAWQLKAWLFGGAEISVETALFSVDDYDGNIISDLFGDDRYFDDPVKFWNLQLDAIIHKQAAYLEAGWGEVIILQTGNHFFEYEHVKYPKDQGGKVYVSCANNGEVEFHEGWLDQKTAIRIEKAKAQGNDNGEDKPLAAVRPELTKAAITYLALHRHNAVRNELLKAPQTALRLIAASVIAGSGLWNVDPENQYTNRNQAISDSVESSKAQCEFAKERQTVRDLLGFKDDGNHLVELRFKTRDITVVFAKLLELSDKDITRILTFIMAETLQAGTAEVEALGHILNVDMGKWWIPDDTFFDLLRDKPMINAMLAEVGDKKTATASISITAKEQKNIIKAFLTGSHGRKKVTGWKSLHMRFPMQAYTGRNALPAIEQWKGVKKYFPVKK